ncbi:MAG: hypothetical protein PUD96_01830 [Coriobacteriaceae bacterium]|nr:hypothetical protein [Coriobacteriaceae bacterium]
MGFLELIDGLFRGKQAQQELQQQERALAAHEDLAWHERWDDSPLRAGCCSSLGEEQPPLSMPQLAQRSAANQPEELVKGPPVRAPRRQGAQGQLLRQACHWPVILELSAQESAAASPALSELCGSATLLLKAEAGLHEQRACFGSWCRRYACLRAVPGIRECMQVLFEAEDRLPLNKGELGKLVELCAPFAKDARYGKAAHACQLLIGMLSAACASEQLQAGHALLILEHFEANPEIAKRGVLKKLRRELEEWLAGGAPSGAEELRVFGLMRELSCPTVAHLPLGPSATASCEGDDPAGSGTRPEEHFDGDLRGRTVTLCGTFKLGRTAAVAGIIENLGGVVAENMTMGTDLLVMGSLPSERYIYGSYGTKAMKALDYRARGLPVQIVGEELFELMVARTQALRQSVAQGTGSNSDGSACAAPSGECEGSDGSTPAAAIAAQAEKGACASSLAPRRLVPAAACL